MKIFSLQSKTSLLLWSTVLGFLINFIFTIHIVSLVSQSDMVVPVVRSRSSMDVRLQEMQAFPKVSESYYNVGFPLKEKFVPEQTLEQYTLKDFQASLFGFYVMILGWKFLANLFFWILVSFALLNLFKYFKSPKV